MLTPMFGCRATFMKNGSPFPVEKRKVLLIVDECTAHVKVSGIKEISVKYLPPNAT